MQRGMCQFLDEPDGLPKESARYRAVLREAATLPEETFPDDVDVGAFQHTLEEERAFMEDGR